ncbi:MAG: extracellular solute-binding protein [Oscillospiraceae bacterium]|nr:extracellular solute-binding protein [Oscillospiraceae bacterium]
MYMKNKKPVLLLISVFIFVILFPSCDAAKTNDVSSPGEPVSSGDDSGQQTNEPEESQTPESVLSKLPKENYNGYTFTVYTSNRINETLESQQVPYEEDTGEIIDDSLRKRDQLVTDYYNINLKYVLIDDMNQMSQTTKKSVLAGDNAFDFAIVDLQVSGKALSETGAIWDFSNFPNVDLNNSWWSKYAINDLMIDGKFYFPVGDITPRNVLSPYLLMFNKKLFEDAGILLPYQTVLAGNWTIDELYNVIKGQTKDLDNDGKMTSDDQYGLFSEWLACMGFLKSMDCSLIGIQNGNPYVATGDERSISAVQKLTQIYSTQDLYMKKGYSTYDEVPIFKNARAMIIPQTASNVVMYRDMDYDYGILPLPKLDTAQTEYYSFAQTWCSSVVVVPKTNPDLERTGMIIEALGAAGRYTSTPAQYDVTLKTKFTRDEYSVQMLDIIYENQRYDFGYIYNWGSIYDKFADCVNNDKPFGSVIESIIPKVEAAIDKIIDVFNKFE